MKSKKMLLGILVMCLGCGWFVKADAYLDREQFLGMYLTTLTQDLTPPDSYQDIHIKYKNIKKDMELYPLMQKAIYYDLFSNAPVVLPLQKKITQDQVCALVKKRFAIDVNCGKGAPVATDRLKDVLIKVDALHLDQQNTIKIEFDDGYMDDDMLDDIYEKLNTNYIDGQNVDGQQMIYDAIQGMVEGLKDTYTTFFPPTDAQTFNEQLEGEYEGIGAYVDMPKPGQIIITSPIVGSPAEKAGIQAGDRILKIDDHLVTTKIDLKTAIGWIKGREGTSVKLIILRANKRKIITVEREKIVVKNISAKTYGDICYMDIGMFGYGVYKEFTSTLNDVFGKTCEKYIFDVRDNPGGSLEEVASMLDHFVPTGKPMVMIQSKHGKEYLYADDVGDKLIDKYLVVLMNEYSASASEIFAGALRDYGLHTVLMGEKSYGKGSVQELLEYPDGSMLKYTIAKRYTGKSETGIDKVGISPDVSIVDDEKTAQDEQLEAAFAYSFGD